MPEKLSFHERVEKRLAASPDRKEIVAALDAVSSAVTHLNKVLQKHGKKRAAAMISNIESLIVAIDAASEIK